MGLTFLAASLPAFMAATFASLRRDTFARTDPEHESKILEFL